MPHFKWHFYLRIPNVIISFDTTLEGSIQNLDTTINLLENLMWKSVKLPFSIKTKSLEFIKFHNFFNGLQNSVLFSNLHSRDREIAF